MKPLLLVLGSASFLYAHEGQSLKPHDLWRAWSFDSGIVMPLLMLAMLYFRGATLTHGVSRRQAIYFWSGWFVLCLALLSPLHSLGEALFSAHMTQHELLMIGAAPLLALAKPSVALLWGTPPAVRRTLGQISKSTYWANSWRFVTRPMTAVCIHGAALWIWHLPRLFQATIENDWVHSAQHVSFLGSALLFWWALLHTHGRSGYGSAVLYLFVTAVHTSILGALATFASSAWYPVYAAAAPPWGLTALEDQQIGGLIMWIPASLVYVIGGLILFAAWLRESDRIAKNGEGQYAV